LFLFDANLASRDWPGLEAHAGDLLQKHGAELVYSERWPDRKLAYEIKTCRKGTYYLTYFNATPEAITGLKRDVQLSERILRLHVMQNEHLPELLEHATKRAEEGSPSEETAKADGAKADGAKADGAKADGAKADGAADKPISGESSVPAEGAPKAAAESSGEGAATAVAEEPKGE